jgi:hypothetical protein
VIVSGNSVANAFNAPTRGAGIYNDATLTLTRSTLSGNSAMNNPGGLSSGGGLFNAQLSLQDVATLTNDTLSGNSAGDGGGIYDIGTLALGNVTLNGNSATNGGGLYQRGQAPTQTLSLQNSILASGLSGANCVEESGSLVTEGYNLSSDATCTPFFNLPTDLNNANPDLGPLADNGGPTLTLMPNPPSPAIDAIPFGVNGCGTTLTTDQRGAPRPIHGQCDIGAVEYGWLYRYLWLALVRR